MRMKFTHRLAQMSDIDDITKLMEMATYELQKDFLTEEQLEVVGQFMGMTVWRLSKLSVAEVGVSVKPYMVAVTALAAVARC